MGTLGGGAREAGSHSGGPTRHGSHRLRGILRCAQARAPRAAHAPSSRLPAGRTQRATAPCRHRHSAGAARGCERPSPPGGSHARAKDHRGSEKRLSLRAAHQRGRSRHAPRLPIDRAVVEGPGGTAADGDDSRVEPAGVGAHDAAGAGEGAAAMMVAGEVTSSEREDRRSISAMFTWLGTASRQSRHGEEKGESKVKQNVQHATRSQSSARPPYPPPLTHTHTYAVVPTQAHTQRHTRSGTRTHRGSTRRAAPAGFERPPGAPAHAGRTVCQRHPAPARCSTSSEQAGTPTPAAVCMLRWGRARSRLEHPCRVRTPRRWRTGISQVNGGHEFATYGEMNNTLNTRKMQSMQEGEAGNATACTLTLRHEGCGFEEVGRVVDGDVVQVGGEEKLP